MSASSALTRYSIKPLDDKSYKLAEKELNEDPKRRKNDIELLRNWLKQQNYLKSIDTDEFLLSFLRVSKFSILSAQERIINFWVQRTELPQWYRNIDVTDPLMQEINDLCYSIPLPEETDDKCRVLLIRTGCWSTTKYDLDDIMKFALLCTDVLIKDPKIQVHGWIGLVDFEGITTSHVQQMNFNFVKNAVRCWQETSPGRIKNLHFLNYPKIFDVAFTFIKMCLKDKIKQRIVFHGNDLKSLHKYLPKRILPTQYGGTAGDLFELNEIWREELIRNNQYLQQLSDCSADLSSIRKQNAESNKTKTTSSSETTGVYRKLNND